MMSGIFLFDTAIGRCGIAWGARGLLGVQLPEANDGKTRARLLRKSPALPDAAPPDWVQCACDAMTKLLRGEPSDLSFIVLDMKNVPPFNRSVHDIARTIPSGETLTYGDIAKQLGDISLSRAVGKALGQNPFPIVVPCHRVVAANGKTGGFSGYGGITTKFRMLDIERAQIRGQTTNDMPMLFESELSVAPPRHRPR